MKSLAWLTLFFVGSNVVGTVLLSLGEMVVGSSSGDLTEISVIVFVLLGPDIFYAGPVFEAAAASLVRHRFGRLTGFTAGLAAALSTMLLAMVLTGNGWKFLAGAWFGSVKLVGALLLAQVPFFRRKVLEPYPPLRFRGLVGTYAASIDSGESPTVSLGRRPSNGRSWTFRRARRPARWASSFSVLVAPPREIDGRVKRELFINRSTMSAWASLPLGLLAALGCHHLYRASRSASIDHPLLDLVTIGLALLALSLPRFGLLRLHERVRLLRLLREGEVVQATRSRETMFDLRSAVITVAETQVGPVVVVSPAPTKAGEVQGLLVGKNGDVVAWDLLPFTPAVDGAGALTVA